MPKLDVELISQKLGIKYSDHKSREELIGEINLITGLTE